MTTWTSAVCETIEITKHSLQQHQLNSWILSLLYLWVWLQDIVPRPAGLWAWCRLTGRSTGISSALRPRIVWLWCNTTAWHAPSILVTRWLGFRGCRRLVGWTFWSSLFCRVFWSIFFANFFWVWIGTWRLGIISSSSSSGCFYFCRLVCRYNRLIVCWWRVHVCI